MEQTRQRLDRWLWFARVVKSRTLAARLIEAGHVRVNSQRSTAVAKLVGAGDVVTVALERRIRVLKVVDSGKRRGPAGEAELLFEDLSEKAARA